ncbi:MAG: YncE family protein [Thermosulfidibacteraceae bacterium]
MWCFSWILVFFLIIFSRISEAQDIKLLLYFRSQDPFTITIKKVEFEGKESNYFFNGPYTLKLSENNEGYLLAKVLLKEGDYGNAKLIYEIDGKVKETLFSFRVKRGVCFVSFSILKDGSVVLNKFSDSFSYVKENLLSVLLGSEGLVGFYDRISNKPAFFVGFTSDVSSFSSSYKYDMVYVSGKDNFLYTYDISTGNVEKIPIMRGSGPVSTSVGYFNSGKEIVFVANGKTENVSIIDMDLKSEVGDIKVSGGPIKVFVDPPPDRLKDASKEVLAYLENYRNLYVLSYYGAKLTIFQLSAWDGKVVAKREYQTGWKPFNLFVDYKNGLFYVINEGSDFINVGYIVIDQSSLFRLEGVGYNIVDGDYMSRSDMVILARSSPGELIFGRVPVTGLVYSSKFQSYGGIGLEFTPFKLKYDSRAGCIYVVDKKKRKFFVFDELRRDLMDKFNVPGTPYDLLLF